MMLRRPTAVLLALLISPSLAAAQPWGFVEPDVEVIRVLEGSTADAHFGGITRNIGDLNRDGIDDFAVCAPNQTLDTFRQGAVYLYDGRTAELLRQHVGPSVDNAELTGPWVGPDLNGDGIPEYGLATAWDSPIGQGWIYNGDVTVPVEDALLFTHVAPSVRDIFVFGEDMGDINNDGVNDVAWSAEFGRNPQGVETGWLKILSGSAVAEGRLEILRTHYGDNAGDWFGNTAGLLDDVDQDGTDDYFITMPQSNPPTTTGLVRIFSGATGAKLCQFDGIPGQSAVLGQRSTRAMEDINGDGVRELYVGDTGDYSKGRETGRVFVVDPVTCSVVWQRRGSSGNERFGTGHPLGHDVTGDGVNDLVIGSYYSDDGTGLINTGKAYIYDAVTGKRLRQMTSTTAEERFGVDAIGVGDLNQDGIRDFLVSAWSAPGLDGLTERNGRAYIIAGQWHKPGCGPADLNEDGILDSGDIGVFVGRFLDGSTLADLNEDGLTDTADILFFIRILLSGC